MVDNRRRIGYTNSCPVHEGGYGGIAQLARALGSYPSCPRFKSRCRYHAAHAAPHGALVKRLRHRPFTAVTRVRFPYASPTSPIWRHSSAGRALASHARGHRFEFCCLHHKKRTSALQMSFSCRLRIYAPLGATARRPVGPLFLSRLQQLRAARQRFFPLDSTGRSPAYPLLRVRTAPTAAPASATGASRTNSHSSACTATPSTAVSGSA